MTFSNMNVCVCVIVQRECVIREVSSYVVMSHTDIHASLGEETL